MNGRTTTPDPPSIPDARGGSKAAEQLPPTQRGAGYSAEPSAGSGTASDAQGPPPGRRPGRYALRDPRRPRIWFELVLIAVSYWAYSLVRNAVPERVELAQHNARWIWEAQEWLGLAFERTVNHVINDITWLIVLVNYFYATLHFAVTIAVLVWLFRRHPGRYGAIRLVLFATTLVALIGYYVYPLAPPRLMEGMDFIDTGLVHNTWGSLSSEAMQSVSNQYAAMPSMHIGWATWCGITIAWLARTVWVRVLGVMYPVATLFTIIATANHFWLDAVGGLLCLAVGYLLIWAWYGQLCYRLPRTLPEESTTADTSTNAAGGPHRAIHTATVASNALTAGGRPTRMADDANRAPASTEAETLPSADEPGAVPASGPTQRSAPDTVGRRSDRPAPDDPPAAPITPAHRSRSGTRPH